MNYTRIATAAILVPAFIFFTLFAPKILFAAVFASLSVVCFIEYSTMAKSAGMEVFKFRGAVAALILPLSFVNSASVIYILVLLVFASIMTAGIAAERDGVPRAAFTFLGVFYVGIAFASALLVRFMPDGNKLFLLACVATWGADVGAYYAGRLFGKTKMAPSISPNKTVEGFIGGVILALLFSVLVFFVLYPTADMPTIAAAGLIGGLIGPIGDMAESKLKRYFGVKNSGEILPGHGGLLDRADALMFSIPFFYVFLTVKGGFY